MIEFGKALRYLPLVRSVAFTGAGMGIPWKALETCFSFPQVKAIEFTDSATFTLVSPFPTDAISACSGLEELSYPTPLTPRLHYLLERQTTLGEVCALERACLSPLVLGMNSAARSLVLPMKTAPLHDMAKIDWPALQSLTLGGSFRTDADLWNTECLPSLFRHTPNLRRLNITAGLPYPTSIRCSVLGCNAPPDVGLEGLRSLTIAYPDPNDAVYSTPFSGLVNLSLRDWPRHYDVVSHKYYRDFWRSPILSATEALSILRRLQAPGLASLELVYSADGADDDLLTFITRAYPKLRHLELHRYRQSSDETVDYVRVSILTARCICLLPGCPQQRIARTVSEISTLVTLRLNLDFQDDPGEGNDTDVDYRVLKQWRSQLSTVGWAVVDMLSERCPLLDGVALLYRGQPPAMWIWCLRSRQATRCCAYDRSPENMHVFSLSTANSLLIRLLTVTHLHRRGPADGCRNGSCVDTRYVVTDAETWRVVLISSLTEHGGVESSRTLLPSLTVSAHSHRCKEYDPSALCSLY